MYLRLLIASSEVLDLRGEVLVEKGAYEGIQQPELLMDVDMAALMALIFEKVVASIEVLISQLLAVSLDGEKNQSTMVHLIELEQSSELFLLQQLHSFGHDEISPGTMLWQQVVFVPLKDVGSRPAQPLDNVVLR